MTHHSCTATDYSLENSADAGPAVRDALIHLRYESPLDAPLSMSYQLLSETPPTGNRSPSTLIHLLDDDSLLTTFSLCRPNKNQHKSEDIFQTKQERLWKSPWWWYRLAQVCRRWRYLVLESPSYLHLTLHCAPGTPVADMLAHSPPLPIVVDHTDRWYNTITAEDEEGIILALQHRDRVLRIHLSNSVSILQRLILALDGEFPILEYLSIGPWTRWPVTEHANLNFPETFRAPHVHKLVLENFATPIQSPLNTTMGNLVTLYLTKVPFSANFHPNNLLQQLSFMHQLEKLSIGFKLCHGMERQLLHTPIRTRVTLPNLRLLRFKGSSAYLEALLPWVTTLLLEKLSIDFFTRMIYSIPHLQQLISTAGNLRLNTVVFGFIGRLLVEAYHTGPISYTWNMWLSGKHVDWQIVSAAQVSHALTTVFAEVENLIFDYDTNTSELSNNEADRARWRDFFRSFGNVKTLKISQDNVLLGQLSRALQPDEGESTMELLPELQKLSFYAGDTFPNAFTLFADARRKAGHPVTIIAS